MRRTHTGLDHAHDRSSDDVWCCDPDGFLQHVTSTQPVRRLRRRRRRTGARDDGNFSGKQRCNWTFGEQRETPVGIEALMGRKSLDIHSKISDLSHPTPCPWNFFFLGNCPIQVNPTQTHRLRRVSRATSCALNISFQGSDCSLTQGETVTRLVVGVSLESILLQNKCDFINDLHVWFRSFRVKLSPMGMMHENSQHFIRKLRG